MMPIQKTDRDTTWNVTADDLTWTLAENAKITVENQHGIDESGYSGNHFKVLGDITVTGSGAYAVRLTGAESSVQIGRDSRISAGNAEAGIVAEGDGAHIVNRGYIKGTEGGIGGYTWATVENYGTIKSGTGMYFDSEGSQIRNYGDIQASHMGIFTEASGTYIENSKGAEISGGSFGIFVLGTGQSEIVNKGVLRADGYAISGGHGEIDVTNTGRIIGRVSLGDGADMIDTRKGTVKGEIHGGDGGDIYKISNAKTNIIEYAEGAGTDEIQSTVSYRLADHVETLRLIGKSDANATGNELDNNVDGNKGDNHLFGRAGVDYLNGGRGNDILTGGTEADVFLFKRTDGKDVINDFEDGMDRLFIEGVFNEAAFDKLDIRQAKGDVIIDFGDGNEIRVEDMSKGNFTFDDIIVLA
jgi:Ca2+-binding RTX toxin-like protein